MRQHACRNVSEIYFHLKDISSVKPVVQAKDYLSLNRCLLLLHVSSNSLGLILNTFFLFFNPLGLPLFSAE